MRKEMWKWSGSYFGYVEDNVLWSKNGKKIGVLRDKEIFDAGGSYIGEIIDGDRLIAKRSKLRNSSTTSFSDMDRMGVASKAARASRAMRAGYEDFLDGE